MDTPFLFYIVLVLAGLTLLVLVSGIVIMARGGEVNQHWGNKLMTLRVTLQALAIISFVLLLLTR